ncbi:c-type cytochrome [Massilia sp. W12]|uniref:c-type cytochrome n=1 Tax=Massilia sp. W12 TaxID=3126507 RepID=UPI0030CCF996
MFKLMAETRAAVLALAGILSWPALAAGQADAPWRELGRPARAAEIAAWDIDVRPDFQGLPRGRGTVAQGQDIWDAKCASCHGVFGESNQVFPPIVGGTSKQDIERGRVAALASNKEPQRTTLMKLSSLSTLWDYTRRAMPWTAPKSLSVDEVYAVTAYILHLGDILPANASLDQDSIRQVQLPNRNGMSRAHGLWRTDGKPDVKNTACMRDCAREVKISSRLPEYAANSHGDLAQQHRLIGTRPQPAASSASAAAAKAAILDTPALLQKHNCNACHSLDQKLVGPAWRAIGAKWKNQPQAAQAIADKIRSGGQGNWGEIPMPPQSTLSEAELGQIADWLLNGAK